MMKLKPKKEDIYEIVGYKEEISIDGAPKDRLGALICRGSDGTEFKVGSGFNDSSRAELWDKRDLLVGNYVRIVYQHITSGRKVPRFPIFAEIVNYDGSVERDPGIPSL